MGPLGHFKARVNVDNIFDEDKLALHHAVGKRPCELPPAEPPRPFLDLADGRLLVFPAKLMRWARSSDGSAAVGFMTRAADLLRFG